MADVPDWAPTPDWAPKDTPSKPAPKPSASPPAPAQRGVLGSLYDVGANIVRSASDAIGNMPAERAKGTAEQLDSLRHPVPWYRPDIAVARSFTDPLRGAWDESKKAGRDIVAGFTTPPSKDLTPAARYAGYVGRNALNLATAPFAPIAGAMKGSGLATDIQAVTGLSKDAAANLPILIPDLAAGAGKLASRAAGGLSSAGKTAGKIFNPAAVDDTARATATIHRIAHGSRRAEAASEAYQLDKHQRVVGNASLDDQRDLARYVDTRSKATPLRNPKLQAAADAMRDVASRYRARIEGVLGDGKGGGPQFVEDYYARLWKNPPKEVLAKLKERTGYGGGKQGSGRSLKARSVPTFEDGLAAGLTPVFENPLDAMKAYTDNMASFLATHDVQAEMKVQGLAKEFPEGQVPAGWVPLKGVRTTTPGAKIIKDGDLVAARAPRVLAAPEGAARVYNNFISKGLDRGDFAPVYQGARKAVNGLTQLKLGLSAFHAAVMGQESIVAEVAKGFGQFSRGEVRSGLKTTASAVAAPVTTALKGGKLRKEVLDPSFSSGLDPRLSKLYTQAGGRVNMDRFYSSTTSSGDFFRSWRNGTLVRDVRDTLGKVKDYPMKGSVEAAAKVLETVGAPIFKSYIPRLKAGAFASRMEAYLRENPNATALEQQRFAERVVDSIDNRFGEMIVDNQFWHKAGFQVGQLLMLSPSWNIGTVREIGGGLMETPASVKGLFKGKGISDKTAYVAALAATNTLINGVATYLHTGEAPQGDDWKAYRTGGTDIHGAPERAQAPGYMKDVYAFSADFPNNITGEIENKANPAISAALSLWQNKDYRGLPIIRPAHVDPQGDNDSRLREAATFAVEQATPISMSQTRAPGSKLTAPERALGIRQAPSYLEDPARREEIERKVGTKEWKQKLRADARAQAAQAPDAQPAPAAPAASDAPPSWAPVPDWAADTQPAPVKAGATNGGDIRPELKPIVDHISSLPELNRITAENDLYHPAADVHGQGRAVDFTVKGGAKTASGVVDQLKKDFAAKGLKVRIINEYANPSPRATGGHIHVQVLS